MKYDRRRNLLASRAVTINGVVHGAWEKAAPDLATVMAEITQSEQEDANSPDFISTLTSTQPL